MAPKKQPKVTAKQKQKLVEDKTFGMKNKNKSAKVQKYITQVEKQVDAKIAGGKPRTQEPPKKSKAELEAEKKNELNQLFRVTVNQPKVPVGVDPKSMVCEFFKQGLCTKGAKCKFSHDLAVVRKVEKIDLYTDRRDGENESMESWNQDQLEKVVDSKHSNKNQNNPTEIICKYFLEALENKKYGWFWECPNGGEKCQYRHALPPGFVLNKKKKEEESENVEKKSIEEEIEEERLKLPTHTPVTFQLFLDWKKRKQEEKEQKLAKEQEERAKEIKAGRKGMSGREMFTYNPDLFVDDEEAFDSTAYVEEDTDVVTVLSATGTSITAQQNPNFQPSSAEGKEGQENEEEDVNNEKLLANVDQSLFGGEEDFGEEDEEGADE